MAAAGNTDATDALSASDIATLTGLCARLQGMCAAGKLDEIPNEAITALLTAGTELYATAAHDHGRTIAPFQDTAAMPATWVVVTTKAMLEAVSLSSFDLAMWSNRLPAGQR